MYIEFAITIILVILAFQDIFSRHINGWYLIPLFVLLIIDTYFSELNNSFLLNILSNIFFLCIQLFLVSLFFLIKEKRFNIINSKIGIGDIILFLVISVRFSFKSYTIFYIFTLILSIFLSLVLDKLSSKHLKSVPLVSYISINFIFWYWLSIFLRKNLIYL